jgi:hypothetical protein
MKHHTFVRQAARLGLESLRPTQIRADMPTTENVMSHNFVALEPIAQIVETAVVTSQARYCVQGGCARSVRSRNGLDFGEHCKSDGVAARSLLSATVGDWQVIDCHGLPTAEAGFCKSAGSRFQRKGPTHRVYL